MNQKNIFYKLKVKGPFLLTILSAIIILTSSDIYSLPSYTLATMGLAGIITIMMSYTLVP